jgi:hypothetical protein
MELMAALHNSTDMLVHFFIKELEHTWRVKFQEAKELVYSKGVDQMVVILDLKGCTLKNMNNKQMMQVYKQLVLEVQRFFPELLYKLYVLNTPVFFENIWETELSSCVDESTIKTKIEISPESTHDDLLSSIDPSELPKLYGGSCECRATCIYSEKGPWSEQENFINYKDPNSRKFDDSDEDEANDISEHHIGSGPKMNLGGLGGLEAQLQALSMKQNQEEFKLKESDEDQIDLLQEKDDRVFDDEEEQFEDLRNQIRMNVPGM